MRERVELVERDLETQRELSRPVPGTVYVRFERP